MLYKETYKKNREKSGQVNTKEEKGIEDISTKKMKKGRKGKRRAREKKAPKKFPLCGGQIDFFWKRGEEYDSHAYPN